MAILSPVQLSDIKTPSRLLNNPDGTGQWSLHIDTSSSARSLSFLVKFTDVEAFCLELAGLPVAFGTGSGATIERALPCQYPWNKNLYAQKISGKAEGLDPDVTIDRPWTYAALTVEFTTLTFDPKNGDQPYLSRDIEATTETITFNGGNLSFSSGERIEVDPGRICGSKAIKCTIYEVPDLAAFEYVADALSGSVNSVALKVCGTTYAAGTILFPTYSSSSQQNILGTPKYQVSPLLLFRSVPWNSGVRSDGVVDTITPAPYPTADLTPLLAF